MRINFKQTPNRLINRPLTRTTTFGQSITGSNNNEWDTPHSQIFRDEISVYNRVINDFV